MTELIKKTAKSLFGYEVTDIQKEMMTQKFTCLERSLCESTLFSTKTNRGDTLYFVVYQWTGYDVKALYAGDTLADGKLFLISTLM